MAADRYVPGTPNVPAATGIGRPRLASNKLSERSKSRETTSFFFSCGDRSGFFLQRFCLRNPGIKMHVGFTSQKCILIFFDHRNSRKRAYVLYMYIYIYIKHILTLEVIGFCWICFPSGPLHECHSCTTAFLHCHITLAGCWCLLKCPSKTFTSLDKINVMPRVWWRYLWIVRFLVRPGWWYNLQTTPMYYQRTLFIAYYIILRSAYLCFQKQLFKKSM